MIIQFSYNYNIIFILKFAPCIIVLSCDLKDELETSIVPFKPSTIDNLSIGLVAKDNIRYGYLPSDKSFRRFIFKPIGDEVVSMGDNEILIYSVKCDGGERRSSLYISEKIFHE